MWSLTEVPALPVKSDKTLLIGSPATGTQFANIIAVIYVLCKVTIRSTFQNLCLGCCYCFRSAAP